ncbi:MAG: molybdenum cofactor guanylyltransferase [Flavobacteriaceae bacterium TMED220]|nr:MAG: molybdenum cofactor guanylyltransferase [Flavobacteriaceae bacterium TMED220]
MVFSFYICKVVDNNIISVYILCGGKNKRMGTEKGLVKINGKSFIELIVNAVSNFSKNIFLVTDNKNYLSLGYPIIGDLYKNKGPVSGIFSALNHSETDQNLILSCDVPFINFKILDRIIKQHYLFNKKITIAKDSSNIHPLIGMYHQSIKSVFKRSILDGNLKLINVIEKIDVEYVKFNNSSKKFLKNINSFKLLDNS